MLSNTTKENEMDFQEGKVVELNQEIPLSPHLVGLRVKMVRKTSTGRFTVETIEARQPYALGERLHVTPDQVRECEKRPIELERDYRGACDYATRWLNQLVEDGKKARQEMVRKLSSDDFEALTREVSWGHGVKEDIMMGLAQHTLELAQQDGILSALLFVKKHCEVQLLNVQHRGQSSNTYSNAVDATRNECLREFSQRCADRAAWISDARAEMEVL